MTDIQKAKIDELRAKGYGYGAVALELGIPVNTVKSYCRRIKFKGGDTEPGKSGNQAIFCECCGNKLPPKRGGRPRRFCCDACRNEWWNSHLHLVKRKAPYKFVCLGCGKAFEVYGNVGRKYCCRECYASSRFGRKPR